ncbi:MAG TPA: hypothetical protein VJ020_10315 [Anaerolineales bacterium]|nr:hypothetical protein [Anaerolineales bacterium]
MPIYLEDLQVDEKLHIAVKANTTWAMIAAMLQQNKGNETWPLVVRKADGSYVGAKFGTIFRAGDAPPETLAESLPGLLPVETVELDSMGTATARDRVGESKARVLVLTKQGKFVTTLGRGVNRSGDLPSGKLSALTSGGVDLSQVGKFLLTDDEE